MEKKTRKEVIGIIKSINRKKKTSFTSCTQWDINSMTYSSLEYAARLLRKKGFDITITRSENTPNPEACKIIRMVIEELCQANRQDTRY